MGERNCDNCCENCCHYWLDDAGEDYICTCEESDYYADYTEDSFVCEHFEEKGYEM